MYQAPEKKINKTNTGSRSIGLTPSTLQNEINSQSDQFKIEVVKKKKIVSKSDKSVILGTKNLMVNTPLGLDTLLQPNATSGFGTPINQARTPDLQPQDYIISKSPSKGARPVQSNETSQCKYQLI